MPFLAEAEWTEVHPLLQAYLQSVKSHRLVAGLAASEATDHTAPFATAAREKFRAITGVEVDSVDVIWHHRLADIGPLCRSCGAPLRSERASFCAECGANAGA